MGACRKRRPNLACAAFPRQPINRKWAYMSKTTVQFYVHTTCRGKCSDSHVCTTSIDTDTPKTTARFDVQHISNRSDVSRVLSLTAAADAHMQSWMAVMLDRKREKTAVRFDVHISETKTRTGTCFHARNDGPFSHVHASPAGNRTNYMRATHALR